MQLKALQRLLLSKGCHTPAQDSLLGKWLHSSLKRHLDAVICDQHAADTLVQVRSLDTANLSC
jgi:hypothetical protein